MGDSITMLAIRTKAKGSPFADEPQEASFEGRKVTLNQGVKKSIFTQIYQIITDTLKTWIYSSKKVSRQAKVGDLNGFLHSSYVGSGPIFKLAEAINNGKTMTVEPNATLQSASVKYPEKDGNKLLAIPLVLDGGWYGLAPDHSVTFVYDPSTSTLEYYDPKGISIQARGDVKTFQGKPLKEIQDEMSKKYQAETLVQNFDRHQEDIHNCGVYVSDYILRRSEGKSRADIQSEPLSFSAANNSRRQELINYVEAVLTPVKATDAPPPEITTWD